MNHIKLFEEFSDKFPDLFNGALLRGVRTFNGKVDREEYIDDPKSRKISIGQSDDVDYREFLSNFSKLGIPDPTKSIHMYFRPNLEISQMVNYYGNTYDIIPQEGSTFGFNKELRNGGLGSTWWFQERTLKDFLNKSTSKFTDYYDNKDKFIEDITKYQQILIDGGVVGKLTYEELIKMSKEDGDTLQVWTEYPCLHKKHHVEIKVKEPKSYKNEPLLKDEDFLELGIDNNGRSKFFTDWGKLINRKLSEINTSDHSKRRELALDILKKWNSNK